MLRIIADILQLFVVILVVRALLSWFPVNSSGFAAVVRALDSLTEPVLRPVRKLIPPVRMGGMALDLSIIIVILGLELIANLLVR